MFVYSLYISIVYDDLVEVRKNNKVEQLQQPVKPAEALYVNPLPNRSLINPDSGTIAQFQRLGLPSEEDEHLYDEVPFEGDVSSSDLELDYDDEDDVIYYNMPKRTSPEHLYDIPPDAM